MKRTSRRSARDSSPLPFHGLPQSTTASTTSPEADIVIPSLDKDHSPEITPSPSVYSSSSSYSSHTSYSDSIPFEDRLDYDEDPLEEEEPAINLEEDTTQDLLVLHGFPFPYPSVPVPPTPLLAYIDDVVNVKEEPVEVNLKNLSIKPSVTFDPSLPEEPSSSSSAFRSSRGRVATPYPRSSPPAPRPAPYPSREPIHIRFERNSSRIITDARAPNTPALSLADRIGDPIAVRRNKTRRCKSAGKRKTGKKE
ncbi:hypothetical protein JCM5353_006646 [Sporobolomyces roseus]